MITYLPGKHFLPSVIAKGLGCIFILMAMGACYEDEGNYDYHELDAVVKEADLVRMQAASQRLRDAAMTYLTGKMPGFTEEDADQPVQYPEGASDYTKRRIDVALDALRLGRQGVEIKPVERQTAQDNLRQAQAAQQRRMEEREPQLIQPAPGNGLIRTV